ncbi:MAG: glycosyltransferase family 4 protein [Bacteroidia bacterium]|nr:glycosyltransferase family 4 protein [Bacteroidia bacterium]NND53007.1 glycosyltransferase family 4 protein [Flavobacteriaceae bacterium]
MKKLIRITTIPTSLRTLLRGQLRFMSQYYEVIGIASNGDALNEVIQNEGVRVHAIEMTRIISPLSDLKSVFNLYRFFKKEKPFIVHTHTPKAGIAGMLAAKLAGIPHRIHTVAGMPLLEETGIKRMLLDWVEKRTYAYATEVWPNSKGLKEIIIKYNYTRPDKVKVIGNGSSNGIDVHHYNTAKVSTYDADSLRQKLKIKSSDFIFIFIGRIVQDKGINELVEAFDQLSKAHHDIKLILVGPHENHLDPLRDDTEAKINSNPNISAVGAIKDIRPYVTISNVLTFPSYREGFPNVVLQASSMERPCIVSNINGCNEIIKDGFNGLIIPPKDVNALREAMEFCLKNPEELQKMANNARPNIVKNYEQEYIWNAILAEYKSLDDQ